MKSSSYINCFAVPCHYPCLSLPFVYPHYSGMEVCSLNIKYFFFLSYSFHNEMASHLLNKYFTSAHLSLKGHSHHLSAIMSFLFLSSYLCFSYLHDLLFAVSLPLQTALLNSDLCFWDLYVWAPVPCKPPRAKQKKKSRFPYVPPPLNDLGNTGILSTAHPSGWVFRLQTAYLDLRET